MLEDDSWIQVMIFIKPNEHETHELCTVKRTDRPISLNELIINQLLALLQHQMHTKFHIFLIPLYTVRISLYSVH